VPVLSVLALRKEASVDAVALTPDGGHLTRENVHHGKHTPREFTPEFKDEAVKLVIDTGRPVSTVARELGVKEATLGRCEPLQGQPRRRRGRGHGD
jgi:hypothetical protein